MPQAGINNNQEWRHPDNDGSVPAPGSAPSVLAVLRWSRFELKRCLMFQESSPVDAFYDERVQRIKEAIALLDATIPNAVCFTKDKAAGMAIRVEDANKIMTSILDGAESTTHPEDHKRRTLIIMARDRNRHLEHVASLLRTVPNDKAE